MQKGQIDMTKTTLYHGSRQEFTTFNLNRLGQNEITEENQNHTESSSSATYPLYSSDALDQYVEDTAQHYTSDIHEAMHLFPDGRMVSSTEEGIRGDDHSVISNYCDNIGYPELAHFERQSMMSVLSEAAGIVIIVPETEKALKTSNQKLTPQQAEILNNSEFKLEDFSAGITEDSKSLEAAGLSKELSQKLTLLNENTENQIKTDKGAKQPMTTDASATIYNGDFHREIENLIQKNYQNTKTKTNELEPGVYYETMQFDVEGRQRQLTMLYGKQNKVELGMDQLSENEATTLKIGGDQQGGQIMKELLDSPQLADREVTFTPNDSDHSEIDYRSPNRKKRTLDQSIGIE